MKPSAVVRAFARPLKRPPGITLEGPRHRGSGPAAAGAAQLPQAVFGGGRLRLRRTLQRWRRQAFRSAMMAVLAGATAVAPAADKSTPALPGTGSAQPDPVFEGDPLQSHAWPAMRREFLGHGARVVWDARVQVEGPRFAEDPLNVPISVRVDPALGPVDEIVVLVDRNPIRQVLRYAPQQALPRIAFRFKLEQGSPVRAAVRSGGVWHVGSTVVDSSGGGCTVSGATRQDGSWSRTLGQVHAGLFTPTPQTTRLRVRVMHPMDTGLVAGVPAFYLSRLTLRDAQDRELARLTSFEPVSENPVFSFDFAQPPAGGVFIVGTDNNGNRIRSRVQ